MLDALVRDIVALAKRYGVSQLVILGIDPKTGNPRRYGDPVTIEAMREFVGEKWGFADVGETAWNDT